MRAAASVACGVSLSGRPVSSSSDSPLVSQSRTAHPPSGGTAASTAAGVPDSSHDHPLVDAAGTSRTLPSRLPCGSGYQPVACAISGAAAKSWSRKAGSSWRQQMAIVNRLFLSSRRTQSTNRTCWISRNPLPRISFMSRSASSGCSTLRCSERSSAARLVGPNHGEEVSSYGGSPGRFRTRLGGMAVTLLLIGSRRDRSNGLGSDVRGRTPSASHRFAVARTAPQWDALGHEVVPPHLDRRGQSGDEVPPASLCAGDQNATKKYL